ncbi:Cis-zeatin O-glucosyltransferase 1 [Acorus calamus]|uniref:Glycosyltransferase n=1 Tax=Acorus calamus TaxID=4465 RepID=A0AAV9C6K0_ACOCL|nr:Cis-zeatin O-glucosyltransferase 1 [Acorus calamus]
MDGISSNKDTPPAPEAAVAVVVVPFPAQGHLNQLFHLSRLLSRRGRLSVHFVGTATHNRQVRLRVHGWDPHRHPVRFHDLPTPPFTSPPPDPSTPNKFPAHLQPTFEASDALRAPFADLLRALSKTSPRVVVVHDALMSFAAREASLVPNAEAYAFHSVSAFASLFFQYESRGADASALFPELPKLSTDGCFTDTFMDLIRRRHRMTDAASVSGRLLNTCRPMEGRFLDLLAWEPFARDKKLWAVGPLNPIKIGGPARHECLKWLDMQPPKSVMYVSFGTTSSLSEEQVREIAIGLERSEQRFLWVLREADRGDIFADQDKEGLRLPDEYERRVRGRGLVVLDGWAPQVEILRHESTGGFMSHCGWNSCVESLSMGVPIAAWPMHSDQPRNAMLVTEVLGVGVTVREWGRRGEVVGAKAVEEVVRRVMVYEEGREMRRKADEIGAAVRGVAADEEGGGCGGHAELDCFVAHITRRDGYG